MENIEATLKDSSYLEFLSENKTLKERLTEAENILKKYRKATFENVERKLRKIMLPTRYKKGEYYETELYSRYKPKKELNYIWKKLEKPTRLHNCPWCPNLYSTTEFEISREMTEKEESEFGNYMTLIMLRCTYEFDAEKGNKKAIKELNKIDFEMAKLEQRPLKTISVNFTNLLPHFIEKHAFFPNAGIYKIDIEFLLDSLNYKKTNPQKHSDTKQAC